MKLTTILYDHTEQTAVVEDHKLVLIKTINEQIQQNWSHCLFETLQTDELDQMIRWYKTGGKEKLEKMDGIVADQALYAPLYRYPRKIWGIGMNYVKDSKELSEITELSEPVSFMKPDTTIIGPNEAIMLPKQSNEVTAEAELAIIIGKSCKNISEQEARNVVAGFTTALDMTAKDIHEKNPRFLTRAKSFDTFFSFGPHLVTADEIDEVLDLKVITGKNGESLFSNMVFNMRYRPWFAVSFHSQVMTLLPGDIILTGTPGATVIRDGDIVESHIEGFESLRNPVIAQ